MSTSGLLAHNEEDNLPLEYVSETEEYICGWCGQLLIPNHNNQTPEAHFKSCKNSKDNRLLKVFKDLRKVQQNLKNLNEKMDTVKAKVMEEVKAELETKNKSEGNNDGALDTFNNKVTVLEDGIQEKMQEMGVDQDMKMAKANRRFTGVIETITTVIHCVLKGMRLRRKKITSSIIDNSEPPKRDVSAREKNIDGDFRVTKSLLLNEMATDESSKQKTKRFHVDHMTIRMDCFNLVTYNHLFQPSYKWIIEGIQTKMEQKSLELCSSEVFQWNGYPVETRAKLQLVDDHVYVSLCFEDASKGESHLKDINIIPQVFYLLKDRVSSDARHKCKRPFCSSLALNPCSVHKAWFNHPTYNVADSVEMEIYVESPRMTQHVHSYDGTLKWNMENYARRLQLEKDGLVPFQESPYFYTGPGGHRVQMEVFLNGDAGRKGLTARLMFVTGNFDGKLLQLFLHSTCTVTLFNRKEPQRSVTKTVEEDIKVKKWYDVEICKLEEVKYLIENDALLFKVRIESQKKALKAKLK